MALLLFLAVGQVLARDIVFPPVTGVQNPFGTPIDALEEKEIIDIDTLAFSGLSTFANLPYVRCLTKDEDEEVEKYDIAVLGAPFDTGVTARPGARFGPKGIRQGSYRIHPEFSYNVYSGQNPFQQGMKVVDCGDAPLTFLVRYTCS